MKRFSYITQISVFLLFSLFYSCSKDNDVNNEEETGEETAVSEFKIKIIEEDYSSVNVSRSSSIYDKDITLNNGSKINVEIADAKENSVASRTASRISSDDVYYLLIYNSTDNTFIGKVDCIVSEDGLLSINDKESLKLKGNKNYKLFCVANAESIDEEGKISFSRENSSKSMISDLITASSKDRNFMFKMHHINAGICVEIKTTDEYDNDVDDVNIPAGNIVLSSQAEIPETQTWYFNGKSIVASTETASEMSEASFEMPSGYTSVKSDFMYFLPKTYGEDFTLSLNYAKIGVVSLKEDIILDDIPEMEANKLYKITIKVSPCPILSFCVYERNCGATADGAYSNKDKTFNVEAKGLFYSWEEANSDNYNNTGKSLCEQYGEGWRIPTYSEIEEINNYIATYTNDDPATDYTWNGVTYKQYMFNENKTPYVYDARHKKIFITMSGHGTSSSSICILMNSDEAESGKNKYSMMEYINSNPGYYKFTQIKKDSSFKVTVRCVKDK